MAARELDLWEDLEKISVSQDSVGFAKTEGVVINCHALAHSLGPFRLHLP